MFTFRSLSFVVECGPSLIQVTWFICHLLAVPFAISQFPYCQSAISQLPHFHTFDIKYTYLIDSWRLDSFDVVFSLQSVFTGFKPTCTACSIL